jgi:hypothetical protein
VVLDIGSNYYLIIGLFVKVIDLDHFLSFIPFEVLRLTGVA